MNTYILYINKLWGYLRKQCKPRGADILLISKVLLLCLFMTFHMLSSAQKPRKDSGADGPMNHVLRGTVVSAVDNKPLDGVSVRVEAEKARTSTKKDGTFSLSVGSLKGLVKFTYVGFKSQEINYTSGVSIIVKLIPDDNKLEEVEVVSTGYQKIPKERATGSFEFVDNKLFNRKVSTDFVSRLEDVVPSISVYKGFSNSKGAIMNMNIRGMSSFKIDNSVPLIVIDGIPYDSKLADYGLGNFNNINPNDIENITVLKDAAAASIWGAQSGNGVIVITTKRGKFANKAEVLFNTNISVTDKPNLYYFPQINTSDYIDLQKLIFDKGKYNTGFNRWNTSLQPILWMMKNQRDGKISEEQLNAELDKLRGIDMRDDFTKYIYRKAINQQYNVQLRAGGEKVNTLFSAGYDKNKNDVVTSSYERLVLKSVSQFKPVKRLQLEMGITYTEAKGKESAIPVEYNQLGAGLANFPYLRLADDNGSPLNVGIGQKHPVFQDTVAGGKLLDWTYNPLNELYESQEVQKINETLLNLSANYSFDFGLSLHGLYGYQRNFNPISNWKGIGTFAVRDEINYYSNWNSNTVTWNLPVGDQLVNTDWNSLVHQGRLNAQYNKSWKEKHELNALVGFDIREMNKELKVSQYYGFDPETGSFQSVQYGKEVRVWNGKQGVNNLIDRNSYQSYTNRFLSSYGNFSYSYLQRYIVSGSFRKDASNLFGVKSNDRGQPFWSVGGAWLMSKENFLKSTVLNLLKLRVTYGYNGNVNNSVSAYPIMNISSNANNITGQNYATIGTPPNPKLRWERVANTNFGADFGIWNNRLSGSIEYYKKLSKDLVSPSPIDPTSGYNLLSINYGNIRSRGWDVSLHAIPLISKDWEWRNDLVFSYCRTIVTKSYIDPSASSSLYMVSADARLTTPVEGADIFSLLTYKWAGLDPVDGSPRAYLNNEISKDYVSIINSKIQDLQNNGSTVPLYFGSFRNSVRYKIAELSWNISYQLGHKFLRSTFSNDQFLTNGSSHSDYALRWQNPGDELLTDVPAFMYPNNAFSSQVYYRSSALVENAGQIKLRDIQFSLELPWAKRIGLKDMRVYGYFQNVCTIWKANKKGIDPEFGNSFPSPFMTSFGLNFKI
ncbi:MULTISPECIES: SusC/RagA family TonB-linked outer membrane protein [unclassified Sphingobacterium]|uniref:SusC/RagA family TonB-linked outer membrane protein n=1 Tax=unclassified Sphingobacterium TaxID=2609468 RepID=UPI00104EA224|nr:MULTISPECIES: SusC/RagA family TonB-linked outer membrane protein [unclassified Sphingobacterium]MCS3556614.1 TonB-linked SusC/RagA family outer membrane protein [Sphingobacterium sp. JUb21]TCQ99906.1 TonB-linked SusC/RagA family outer membrane protein [Sphingobacterium sp. JUb20]